MQDIGSGRDGIGFDAGVILEERGRVKTNFKIEKWDLDQVRWVSQREHGDLGFAAPWGEPDASAFRAYNVRPFETKEWYDVNLITDAGWVMMMDGIGGSAVTKFSATVGRIGLGTVAAGTAAAYTDTALGAIGSLTTHNWELCGAAPTIGSTHAAGMSFAATFPTGDANGVAITEFAVDSGTAAALTASGTAPMMNHSIIASGSYGTKTSAQVWNATVTFTWS